MGEKIDFLVVDDHPIFRQGLVALIQTEKHYRVCAEAGSVAEALTILETQRPALALVDITLADRSGLDLVKAIRASYPEVQCLIISIHDEQVYAERALKAQARGYVMKQEAASVILEAIRTILAGKIYVSPAMRERLLESRFGQRAEESAPVEERLSDRELEILTHLGRGSGATEIAGLLNISVKTVNVHQDHLKKKLGLEGAAELRKFAVGWVRSQT
jgi:DNA-binding NarL/FixJ family response regulator